MRPGDFGSLVQQQSSLPSGTNCPKMIGSLSNLPVTVECLPCTDLVAWMMHLLPTAKECLSVSVTVCCGLLPCPKVQKNGPRILNNCQLSNGCALGGCESPPVVTFQLDTGHRGVPFHQFIYTWTIFGTGSPGFIAYSAFSCHQICSTISFISCANTSLFCRQMIQLISSLKRNMTHPLAKTIT